MQAVDARKALGLITRRSAQLIRKMQGKHIVHFLHIGKTGGTAIRHVLNEHSISSSHAVYLHDHDFTLRDVPEGESVVFFLRDPISRFVSGFYSRQRQGRPRYFTPWTPEEKRAFEHFSTPNELAMSLSSPDRGKQAEAQLAMKNILHVKHSCWEWFESEQYFRSRARDVFFVGFQESLAEDFRILKSKLGLPATAKLPEDDVQAHRNPAHLDRALEDEAVENLKHWYEHDYRFLGLCAELLERDRLGSAIGLNV